MIADQNGMMEGGALEDINCGVTKLDHHRDAKILELQTIQNY
jgi:hypothetical protein